MNENQLRTQIEALLGIVNLTPEDRKFLTDRLPGSTLDQLVKVKDSLLRQAVAEVHVATLRELNQSDELMDEAKAEEIRQTVKNKVAAIEGKLFSESEIDRIQKELEILKQNPNKN